MKTRELVYLQQAIAALQGLEQELKIQSQRTAPIEVPVNEALRKYQSNATWKKTSAIPVLTAFLVYRSTQENGPEEMHSKEIQVRCEEGYPPSSHTWVAFIWKLAGEAERITNSGNELIHIEMGSGYIPAQLEVESETPTPTEEEATDQTESE